jgi:hypothetical protein
MVAIMAEKQKIIFWLDSGACFSSYLSLPVPGPMTRLSFGANLASPWSTILPGLWLALGETSSLSLFPHST